MRFYTVSHKHYCGVDLHTQVMYLCIVNHEGEVVVHRNMKSEPQAFLAAIAPYREDLVVVAECIFCWYWLADLCAREGICFHTMQPAVLEMVRAGRIKGLAVSSAKRTPAAPEIPTIAESGVPGFENVAWHALYAPAKTPASIIAKLNAQVTKILRDPDVEQRLASQAAMPSPGTPESLRRFMLEETERATRVMRSAGLTRQ